MGEQSKRFKNIEFEEKFPQEWGIFYGKEVSMPKTPDTSTRSEKTEGPGVVVIGGEGRSSVEDQGGWKIVRKNNGDIMLRPDGNPQRIRRISK